MCERTEEIRFIMVKLVTATVRHENNITAIPRNVTVKTV